LNDAEEARMVKERAIRYEEWLIRTETALEERGIDPHAIISLDEWREVLARELRYTQLHADVVWGQRALRDREDAQFGIAHIPMVKHQRRWISKASFLRLPWELRRLGYTATTVRYGIKGLRGLFSWAAKERIKAERAT